MRSKKNIVILIAHYLPGFKFGGPLTSILNMVNRLSNEFNFKIVTSDRDLGDTMPYPNLPPNRWVEHGNTPVYYLPDGIFKIASLIKSINRSKCDFVYINSFFHPTFSIAVILAAKLRLLSPKNIIVAPRGELFDEAINFRKGKKRLYLRLSRFLNLYSGIVWHASTEQEKQSIIKAMGVPASQVRIALNLSAEPSDGIVSDSTTPQVNQSHRKQPLQIVFLARISKDKNVPYIFDVLSKISQPVVLDLYGPIEDQNIWEACQQKIKRLPPNITVSYRGSLSREKVRSTLGAYDLFFLPTLAENYGHVIVEALSAGTPVLISDNTPWRDLQRDGLGWDINLSEPEKYIQIIEKMATDSTHMNIRSRTEVKRNFFRRIDSPEIFNANVALFNI